MPVYKDEAKGTWFVKCYYTDYTGVKRQRKKRGFKLQREAKEWERDFLASLQYDGATTFGSVAENFIQEITPWLTSCPRSKILPWQPLRKNLLCSGRTSCYPKSFQTSISIRLIPYSALFTNTERNAVELWLILLKV